ncbi:hypothetical protein [Streptomyces zaomyceticus]
MEQTRGQSELIAKLDEMIRRTPRAGARDAEREDSPPWDSSDG